MIKNKSLITLIVCLLNIQLHAKIEYEIPEDIRHTISRNDESEIIYYEALPVDTHETYPITIICVQKLIKMVAF